MKEIFLKLGELGYAGDKESLSEMIDWIRRNHDFNIWIEHGVRKGKTFTHDVTTNFGCHRGSYTKYELAQFSGIKIFLNNNNNI